LDYGRLWKLFFNGIGQKTQMSKPMECLKCKDWKENIGTLNDGFVLSAVRGFGGYRGKTISHCPWCGEVLTETKNKLNTGGTQNGNV